MPDVAKTKYAVIPQGTLSDSNDVITTLASIVKSQSSISNFIVTTKKENGFEFIELLEETGAA
jgi:hypothetical protein